MRRTLAGFALVAGFALLTACGGGGGGGSTPPVTGPSGNPGPSSHPSSSPSPGPSPTGSATPSPTPKPSPTPSPTPKPTTKPTPTPTPVPSATPNRTTTLHAGDGTLNGTDNMILSSAQNTHNNTGEGDLMPGDPGAQANGGGQCTLSSPFQCSLVDPNESFPWGNGIPAATTMSNNYHVHAFLGLYVNGQEIAIPDGIGIANPFGDFQGVDPSQPSYNTCASPDINFECYGDQFYYIHTHTPDGIIHMEATTPVCGNWQQPPAGTCPTIFTLGNVLDVWGITISPNNFGPFTGPVTIYSSPPGVFNPCSGSSGGCYTGSNTYSLYTGDPTQLPLNSHTVVWILVGSGNPTGSSLPNIEWYAAH